MHSCEVRGWAASDRFPILEHVTADPAEIATSLGLVVSRSEARAAGLGDRRISRLMAGGRWLSLGHGRAAPTTALDEHRRWRAEVVAAVTAQRRDLVLSHAHAARAWGLPAPLGGWPIMTFTAAAGPTRYRSGLRIGVAPLPEPDVAAMGRVRVTSPSRTVLDCARSLPGPDALAVADRALRLRMVSAAELQDVAVRQHGWPGAPQARRVLELASGRRETPIESWSGWSFEDLGLPRPLWQVIVLDVDGVFVARPDALWAGGVVGEADGRLKYRLRALERGGVNADSLASAFDDERRRELDLRRLGASVVRWGAVDVRVPRRARALAEHLRAEIAGADAGRFRGTVIGA
jgi:hypothetical protein